MHFFLLSITAPFIFGLVAADSSPNSFDTWKQGIPTCAQPCLNDFYSNSVGTSCASDAASSTKLSDLQCVCTAMEANLENGGNTALQCSSSKCGSGGNIISEVTAGLQGLASMCAAAEGSASSSSSSSSLTSTGTATTTSTKSTSTTTTTTTTTSPSTTPTSGSTMTITKPTLFWMGVLGAFFGNGLLL